MKTPTVLASFSQEGTPEGCTIHKFTVRSPCMDREIKAAVVLPPEYGDHADKDYPILYTLHGMAAPYDTFSAMAPLRKALGEKPMIVTCFDGDIASAYLDSPYRQKWSRDTDDTTLVKSFFTTFFLEEFIPSIDKNYRVNSSQRMLTGFSMGGFGAFHYMLTKPNQFISVSSLSGWFESLTSLPEDRQQWVQGLLGPYPGNEGRYGDVDLYTRVKKQREGGLKLPPIYLHCGTEDFLLEANRKMHAFLNEQGIACEYKESPGSHDWPFWRDASAGIVDFHWRVLQEK